MANKMKAGVIFLLFMGGCGESIVIDEATGETTSCPLTEAAVVETGLGNPRQLQVDEASVYYLQDAGPDILFQRIAKDGAGSPQTLFTWRRFAVVGTPDYAVGSSKVYVMDPAEGGGQTLGGGHIEIIDKADPSQSQSVAPVSRLDCVGEELRGLALAGDGTVYWMQDNFSIEAEECTQLPVAIAKLVPGETTAHLIGDTPKSSAVTTADNSHFFWASPDTGIFRISHNGGEPELLSATSEAAAELTLDTDAIASTAFYTTAAKTFSIATFGTSQEIFSSRLVGLTSDGANLFGTVARNMPGNPAWVNRIKFNGHGLAFLGKGAIGTVAVDDTFIYFVDSSGTQIMKACK